MAKNMTLQEIADKIAWEGGVGEAFNYFGRELPTDDAHLKYLWREAYDAVRAVEAVLPESESEE